VENSKKTNGLLLYALIFVCGTLCAHDEVKSEQTAATFTAPVKDSQSSPDVKSQAGEQAKSAQTTVVFSEQEIKSDFYKTYIETFYPRAMVIRNYFFEQKTIDEIAQALKDILKVIVDVPWFYVANNNKGFKIRHYWEFFDDQLFIIDDYIKNAYVNKETKKVCSKKPVDLLGLRRSNSYFEFMKKNQRFTDYCNKHSVTVFKDFYALRFDFMIKLFNEAILFKDYSPALKLYRQLSRQVTQLEGSLHEVRYRNSLAVAQQLLDILRQDMVLVSRKGELDELVEHREVA
jgi:hypothetical protein